MTDKKCSKCKKIKDIKEFSKDKSRKDGHIYQCKECRRKYWLKYYSINSDKEKKRNRYRYSANLEKESERKRKYRMLNPDKIREIQRNYYMSNLNVLKEKHKKYREANLESFNERTKKWRLANPERMKDLNKKWQEKRWSNISYRLNSSIRCAVNKALRGNKNDWYLEDLLGYTLEDLIIHLEKLFKPGMSWENCGKWHIDHIKPVSSFKFESPEDPEFKECWALDNLQPLWAEENIRKGNKYE